MSSAWGFILSLRLRGVTIVPSGDELEIIAPAGALTQNDLAEMGRRKPEIIETLIRRQSVDERVRVARKAVDERLGTRIRWETDSTRARDAERHLEQCMDAYIEGTGSLEEVQAAFKSWIHTLEVETA